VLAAALQLHDTRPPTPLGVADYAAMLRAATPEVRLPSVACFASVGCRHHCTQRCTIAAGARFRPYYSAFKVALLHSIC
jgi:hypothetical protein